MGSLAKPWRARYTGNLLLSVAGKSGREMTSQIGASRAGQVGPHAGIAGLASDEIEWPFAAYGPFVYFSPLKTEESPWRCRGTG